MTVGKTFYTLAAARDVMETICRDALRASETMLLVEADLDPDSIDVELARCRRKHAVQVEKCLAILRGLGMP
jgi:hypothetical protein